MPMLKAAHEKLQINDEVLSQFSFLHSKEDPHKALVMIYSGCKNKWIYTLTTDPNALLPGKRCYKHDRISE